MSWLPKHWKALAANPIWSQWNTRMAKPLEDCRICNRCEIFEEFVCEQLNKLHEENQQLGKRLDRLEAHE